MKALIGLTLTQVGRFNLTALAIILLATDAQARDRQRQFVNEFGAPIRDRQGCTINYSREELSVLEMRFSENNQRNRITNAAPRRSMPAGGSTSLPFWQYALFGSGIGASNIIVGPVPVGGGPREIIIGGNSLSDFGADDFWQAIRYNQTTDNYDQLFVSPVYSAKIKRIAVGNVVGDSRQEIVVMLEDGRIFFYDRNSKAEVGVINTGISPVNGRFLSGLSVADLDNDGYAELVLTTLNGTSPDDLFVFSNDGQLLWQVANVGGSDVIVGQMDEDPALEIAVTEGKIVDAATHTVQWTRDDGFGSHLKLAPLPGTAYQQLIVAERWNFVYAYDVRNQQQRWTINTPQDIGAIEVADINDDGTPEVIIGDAQWGTLHVHDLITQALKWETDNPEHGVTNIAIGDVDSDGVVDLLWGAGSGTGPNYLYVAGTTGAHAIKWQNINLIGPFLGPLIGDLDGDGQPELVACSYATAEHDSISGRILVFDASTLVLRGMSPPVMGDDALTGVHNLNLSDLDNDGRMEIAVAADRSYNGAIEVYEFNSNNTFTIKWTNTTSPPGSPFNFVEVADLDGNGTPEIITANSVETTASEGVYVYIYDYPSGVNPWRSGRLLTGFNEAIGLVVDDIAGNGGKKIATLVTSGHLYTFDGATRQLENVRPPSGGTILSRRFPSGLIMGDVNGTGHFLSYSNNSYTESFAQQLGPVPCDGINSLSNGSLWVGCYGTIHLRLPPIYDHVEWQGPQFGSRLGRFAATDYHNGQTRIFTASEHAVAGLYYQSSLPAPSPSPTAIPSATPAPSPTPSPMPTPLASSLGNISTRLRVETGDNVLIGGMIVTGTERKKVLIRAIGPSLANFGILDTLANPTLELRGSSGELIAFNNDWRSDQEGEIAATGIPPGSDLESAIVALLPAHNTGYTAIVRGISNGTGTAIVEVYDLDQLADSKLANISTRGLVQTNDNVLIAGTIVLGQVPKKLLIRAIGPSLSLPERLSDPTLELRDGNGTLINSNDNWRSDQETEIIATMMPPSSDLESAIVETLSAQGAVYTAIVRGTDAAGGIAVVEIYALN